MKRTALSSALLAELPCSEKPRNDAHPASQKTGPLVVASKNTDQASQKARPLAANTLAPTMYTVQTSGHCEEKRLVGESKASDENDEDADADRSAGDAGECDNAAMLVDNDEDATMKDDDANSDDAEMQADGDDDEIITDDAMQVDGDEIIDEVHDDTDGRCADS